jgi:integral membrane sensor domain MASE1
VALAFGAGIGTLTGGTVGSATASLTTSGAVPAGGLAVLCLAYFKGLAVVNPTGITIGGNAMTNNRRTPNGSDICEIWSYY